MWCWAFLTVAGICIAQEDQAGARKNILVLHSYHKAFQWTNLLNEAVEEEMSQTPFDTKLFIEFMDTKQFPTEELFPRLHDLYVTKYKNIKFDLILSSDNNAFDFLKSHRDKLFPGAPVVFCGLNNLTPAMLEGFDNITGITEDYDLKGTIELILTVQPDVKMIAVVTDVVETGRLHRQRFLDTKPLFEDRVAFLDLAELNLQEVLTQIKNMPQESAVISLSFHRDREGRTFSGQEGLTLLSRGEKPLYTCWRPYVDFSTGGVVTSSQVHGQDAARIGIEILRGKQPSDIPIATCRNIPMFNYTYLTKFNLNMENIPPDSYIINQPESFYHKYRTLILSVISIFIAMTCLIIGLAINILKRRQAQQQLGSQRNFTETVLNTADALVIVMNTAGEVLVFNRACQQCTGYTLEEMQSTPFWDVLLLPEDREPIVDIIHHAKTKVPKEFERYWITKNGDRRLIHWLNSVILDRFGDVEFIMGTGIDVTEQREMEVALQKSEEDYRYLVENLNEGIVKLNGQNEITFVNPSLASMLGETVESLKGKSFYTCIKQPHQDQFTHELGEESHLKTRKFDTVLSHQDGHDVYVIINASPVFDENGQYNGLLASITDVSETIKLQKYREELLRMLEQKNEELESIIYAASHDLKSPIVNINGFGTELDFCLKEIEGLLKDLDVDNDKRKLFNQKLAYATGECLNFIKTSAMRIDILLNGLLKISRLGRAEVTIEKLDMNKIMREVLATLQYQINRFGIIVEVDESLPACYADKNQIIQVFSNLVDNAIKYRSPDRPLRLEVSGHIVKNKAEYCIKDNGIGIDTLHCNKIFDIFHRLHPQGPVGGEGLGLTIVKRILDRYNGSVHVESEKNVGSCFYVQLPVNQQ